MSLIVAADFLKEPVKLSTVSGRQINKNTPIGDIRNELAKQLHKLPNAIVLAVNRSDVTDDTTVLGEGNLENAVTIRLQIDKKNFRPSDCTVGTKGPDAFLKCSKCEDKNKDPKSKGNKEDRVALSCGHLCCKACLVEALEQTGTENDESNFVVCPICFIPTPHKVDVSLRFADVNTAAAEVTYTKVPGTTRLDALSTMVCEQQGCKENGTWRITAGLFCETHYQEKMKPKDKGLKVEPGVKFTPLDNVSFHNEHNAPVETWCTTCHVGLCAGCDDHPHNTKQKFEADPMKTVSHPLALQRQQQLAHTILNLESELVKTKNTIDDQTRNHNENNAEIREMTKNRKKAVEMQYNGCRDMLLKAIRTLDTAEKKEKDMLEAQEKLLLSQRKSSFTESCEKLEGRLKKLNAHRKEVLECQVVLQQLAQCAPEKLCLVNSDVDFYSAFQLSPVEDCEIPFFTPQVEPLKDLVFLQVGGPVTREEKTFYTRAVPVPLNDVTPSITLTKSKVVTLPKVSLGYSEFATNLSRAEVVAGQNALLLNEFAEDEEEMQELAKLASPQAVFQKLFASPKRPKGSDALKNFVNRCAQRSQEAAKPIEQNADAAAAATYLKYLPDALKKQSWD